MFDRGPDQLAVVPRSGRGHRHCHGEAFLAMASGMVTATGEVPPAHLHLCTAARLVGLVPVRSAAIRTRIHW